MYKYTEKTFMGDVITLEADTFEELEKGINLVKKRYGKN